MLVYRPLPTVQAPTNPMNIFFDNLVFYVVGTMDNSFGGWHLALISAILSVIYLENWDHRL